MKTFTSSLLLAVLIGAVGGSGSGCARRMTIATGTTIGLHATPGDGKSQSPQITFAYKRAEMALVPTGGKAATKEPDADSYSALAIVDFRTKWFSGTSIDQFVATGHAARDIQEEGDEGKGNEFTAQLVKYANSDTAKLLRDWIKSAPDKDERKKREQAIADWIRSEADYNFADLLTDAALERERRRFISEKGKALNIPRNP